MNAYLRNRWIRIGLVLVLLGWGPLLAIGFLAAVGLWPDPNPNPIGPGLLFFFTAWPAILCLGVGMVQVRRERAGSLPAAEPRAEAFSWSDVFRSLPGRLLIGFIGVGLVAYGLKHFFDPPGGRGGGGALILAVVAFYWAIRGEAPSWFRRRF